MVLKYDARNIEAIASTGQLLSEMEQYKEASTILEELLASVTADAHPPLPPSVWVALATSYVFLEEYPKAHHTYQKALSVPGIAQEGDLWLGISFMYERMASYPYAEVHSLIFAM